MQTAFELLADPTRRRLLDELLGGELSVGDLVDRLGMSQPAVSKQLRVLRETGLASVRVDAQRRIYRLNPERLREVDDWLAPYRAFWEDRLDAMERTLDAMEDGR
ncbi:MAG: metalloregulator ArsR/SmtB family transcription factor [Acidobacteriota bacterium]